MIIIGTDFHPEFQQIAFVDSDTGELQEKRLAHREEAEKFYRGLAAAGQQVPTTVGAELARKLSIKRFVEFGANHPSYESIRNATVHLHGENMLQVLREQLARSIGELDLTDWQKTHLQEIGISTVGQILRSDESFFIERLRYVGPKRARRIKNAADAAVLEYLSG